MSDRTPAKRHGYRDLLERDYRRALARQAWARGSRALRSRLRSSDGERAPIGSA
jgi:hypothetical protein